MVIVKVTDRHFSDGKTNLDVPLLQLLKLKMNHSVFIGKKSKVGWSGELPFFITTCGNHGYFIDYCHGWKKNFACPECVEMELLGKDLATKLEGKVMPIAVPLPQFMNRMPSRD